MRTPGQQRPAAPTEAVGPAAPPTGPAGRVAPWRRPAVAILLLAPVLGEVLSTSTPPLDLLLPWILALQVMLYGGGALLCREVARRHRLGVRGLVLLAAAYGVYEEALVTGFWFDPGYQDDVGVGGYSRVWHTNLLLATHLTAFHAAVSIGSSVLLVERLFPAARDRPWAGRRGLGLAVLGLAVGVPLGYGTALRGPVAPMLAATGLGALLVLVAFRLPRRPPRPRRRPPRLVGPVAFLAAGSHFLLVYAVPSTGLPWPAGLVLALAPLAAAAAYLRPRTTGPDAHGPVGLRIVAGMLAFFLVLDALVGLGGRYDLTVAAVAGGILLRRLTPRAPPGARPGPSPPRRRPRRGRRRPGAARPA